MPIRSDLQQILDEAWVFLVQGIRNPESRVRTPVLATVDRNCTPEARTVVIERIDSSTRKLFFNTDRRSPKIDDIRTHPLAVFVFHEADTQLRIRATLILHHGDDVARRSWETLPSDMRALYATKAAPGARASDPTSGLPPGMDPVTPSPNAWESGFPNYTVLEATATHLDWLCISNAGHRRASFHWKDDGEPEGSWIFP